MISSSFSPSSCWTHPGAATPQPPSTLWIPQHELREQWADFGAEALSSVALTATGHAFHALSWEANALRQYNEAWHQWQQGRTSNASVFHMRAAEALKRAHRCWSTVQDWLDRLANNRALCVSDEDVEQVRALIHHAVEVQWRLEALMASLNVECQQTGIASLQDACPPASLSSSQPQEGSDAL